MQDHIISATKASRSLSDILNKVHYQKQSFGVKRGREIIARIVPSQLSNRMMKIAELNAFLKNLPHLEQEDKQLFEHDLKEIRAQTQAEEDPWD